MSALVAAVARRFGAARRDSSTSDAGGPFDIAMAMAQAMAHRGDALTHHHGGEAALAVRGRDRGPFAQHGALTAVIDGRIDNRAALIDAGVIAPQDEVGDAEIVARAFLRWGRECAAHLLGDFAFVVWDGDQGLLLAARDRLGVKPLYYHDGSHLLVATEAQALVASGLFAREPDMLSVALMLSFQHDEGRTWLEGVRSVPPGHWLEAKAGDTSVSIRRYWSPDPWRKMAPASDDEHATLFADTFREAVRCRMTPGRTLGITLSGGMDSSAVACQASALANGGGPPAALHLGFPGLACDEERFSRAVAARWAMPTIDVDSESAADAMRPAAMHPDVVYHPTQTCFAPLLARAREQGVSAVLTGLGGDQWLDETGTECADALAAGRIAEGADIAGLTRRPWAWESYRRLWQAGLKRLVPERARIATRRWRPRQHPLFLSRRWGDRVLEAVDESHRRRPGIDAYPDHTSAALCRELDSFSTRVPLAQADVFYALAGLEVAHPFFDVRIFELMLAMPRAQRIRRGIHKHKPLLRRALAELMPATVLERTDAAEFSCYMRDVFVRWHRRDIVAILDDSRLARLGIIDPRAVRAAFEEGLSTPHSVTHFGLIVSMEVWLRQVWS